MRDAVDQRDLNKRVERIIEAHHLESFFLPGNPFLGKVIRNAVRLANDPTNIADPLTMAYLGLYRVVIYCGGFQTKSYCAYRVWLTFGCLQRTIQTTSNPWN
jgi:hypothetical protein